MFVIMQFCRILTQGFQRVWGLDMYDDDERYGLTDDERAAGLGDVLRGGLSRRKFTTKSKVTNPNYPLNHGEKWSSAEAEDVERLFKSGLSIQKIALQKQRTAYAIAYRLYDANLITRDQRDAVRNGNDEIFYAAARLSTYKSSSIQMDGALHIKSYPDDAEKMLRDLKEFNLSDGIRKKESEINGRRSDDVKSGVFYTVLNNFKKFLMLWAVLILINQVFIFNACFAPHCLIAALPHTGVIAIFINYVFRVRSG